MGRRRYCVANRQIRQLFAEMLVEDEPADGELAIDADDWTIKRYYEKQAFRAERPSLRGKFWRKLNCTTADRVHFHCKECNADWSSAQARLIFYYKKEDDNQGIVFVQFLRQQCKLKHSYSNARWPEEAMETAMNKLIDRIHFYYYNGPDPRKPVNVRERRGDPQHIQELCEACALNECQLKNITDAMAALKI